MQKIIKVLNNLINNCLIQKIFDTYIHNIFFVKEFFL